MAKSGGYVYERKIYRLEFEDDLAGLWIRCRSASLGTITLITQLSQIEDAHRLTKEEKALVDRCLILFSRALVDWNLQEKITTEDDDAAEYIVDVPADREGLESCDIELVIRLMMEWMKAISGVMAPLKDASDNGSQLAEASIPMETLSGSL